MQRVIADFGGEYAFNQVIQRLNEHYGISAPTSSIREITQKHARQIYQAENQAITEPKTAARIILSETDGSMVPIVKIKEKPLGVDHYDARKHKELVYKEARLSLARQMGERSPKFAGTLGESVDVMGKKIRSVIEKVGFNDKTTIHAVGDGAQWISDQMDVQFAGQAYYLVDFYHVCEYLANAAATCGKKDENQWIKEQKERLKTGRVEEVLSELLHYREVSTLEDKDAPVRCCYRYLSNRKHQLNYAQAIAKGLPIGSGEIESAHRYVIQKRLKITGAWWKEDNAAYMLALRINRANSEWDAYWSAKKLARG